MSVEINSSSQSSLLSNTISVKTTKSELIQCILNSFQSSLSSINKIYIYFNKKNFLGFKVDIHDLLEEIEYNRKCSCHQIDISFNNHFLNQQLSFKQKQSMLCIILRRQLIFDKYFSYNTQKKER